MYAEFSQISLHSMSNSEMILVKEETKRIEFDTQKRSPLEFQEKFYEATAIYNSSNDDRGRRQVPEDDDKEKGEESNVKEAASIEIEKKNICLAEFKATVVDDDDDGFKTPTSLDHKIPEMKQCPPAPRKTKANKRRTSPAATASTCGNLQLNLSRVEESWFPAWLGDDLHRKVKKARTQEN